MKRDVSRQERLTAIAQAIGVIESQRETLGEVASRIALFALRQKMAALNAEQAAGSADAIDIVHTTINSNPNAHIELVVLAADLSGFTALAERMDAERVRDAINAMWQVLDAVVESWGGQIDQHAGDGMVALFGLPRLRRTDPVRALHTALALQDELAVFNAEASQQRQGWAAGWPGPTMRVGVHLGPVFFGKGGYANRHTAVGDTVNLAKALEQAAPAGGVLVSTAVAQQVQPLFELASQEVADRTNGSVVAGRRNSDDSRANTAIAGAEHLAPDRTIQAPRSKAHNGQPQGPGVPLMRAYRVVAENHNDAPPAPGLIAGQETRFIGRERELDFLEQALHTAMDGRISQFVLITAEPGVGASRLLYEFERRLKLLPGGFTVFRSQAYPDACKAAPALFWRDLIFRYGGIRLQDSLGVMREKLARTIAGSNQYLSPATIDEDAYRLADTLLAAWENGSRPSRPHSTALKPLGRCLERAGKGTTLVMLLDPLHQVDDASLAVLEAIIEQQGVDQPADLPLLVLGTARPEFLDQHGKWQEWPSDPFAPYHHLDLQPLSAIDSRHMLVETLQRLPSPPLRLLDLIAAGARGNPLFMEEMVKLLLNKGVIITDPSSGRWRVEMPQVEATRLPTTLDELFHARLAQMPPPERQLLAAAATMGLVFWDAALWQEMEGSTELPASVVDAALLDLEQKRLIAPNETWSFANTQAYTFAHRQLRDAAYDALSPARRRAIHQQVAQWLLTCRQHGRVESSFPPATLIAHHLEQAGEAVETLS